MEDPSLPLTLEDKEEWGDPAGNPKHRLSISSYCPLHNITPQVRRGKPWKVFSLSITTCAASFHSVWMFPFSIEQWIHLGTIWLDFIIWFILSFLLCGKVVTIRCKTKTNKENKEDTMNITLQASGCVVNKGQWQMSSLEEKKKQCMQIVGKNKQAVNWLTNS